MTLAICMNDFVGDASFAGFDQMNPVVKHREWRTDIVEYGQFTEQAGIRASRPRRHWFVNWAIMDKAGRDKLLELFDAARGRGNIFWWLDDDEYLASAQQIATNGSDISYQLTATYHEGETYEWTEDKKAIVPGADYPPVIMHNIDGAQTEVAAAPGANQYVLDDDTGIMTWGAATPPSAGILTCTFEYYFRVRFASDVRPDSMPYARLYEHRDIEIVEAIR